MYNKFGYHNFSHTFCKFLVCNNFFSKSFKNVWYYILNHFLWLCKFLIVNLFFHFTAAVLCNENIEKFQLAYGLNKIQLKSWQLFMICSCVQKRNLVLSTVLKSQTLLMNWSWILIVSKRWYQVHSVWTKLDHHMISKSWPKHATASFFPSCYTDTNHWCSLDRAQS